MIDKLVDCCYERLSLGQSDVKQLADRLASLSESERKYVCYHSEYRKPIVNMSMVARLRSKRVSSGQCCFVWGFLMHHIVDPCLARPITSSHLKRQVMYDIIPIFLE